MELSSEQVQGRVVVTILKIKGDLDGTNYQDLIALAQKEHENGARNFLVDLSETTYTSSAGLVALQSIVKLLRNEKPFDLEAGWGALHEIAVQESKPGMMLEHIKLLSPLPRVDKVLELAGMKSFFQIFTERNAAVASF